MNNRLSFAQILQKKQSTANHPPSCQQSPSIPFIPSISQSRISHTSNPSSNPTSMRVSKVNTNIISNISPYSRSKSMDISLYQMMEQFINNPNQLQDNFVISFDQSQGSNQYEYQHQYENEQGNDFQVGVNPLDSFIMSQSKACGKNKRGIGRQQSHGGQPVHRTNNIYQGSTGIGIPHPKTNQQLGNADNILNLLKKPQKQQLKTSHLQHHNQHSHHQQRASHIISSKVQQNNQKSSIINSKIVQSQNYPNICHQNKKNQNIHDLANLDVVTNENVGYMGKGVNLVGVPRIQRSEGVDVADTRKLSRYQINYLESQRKQEPKQESDLNKQPPILQQSQSQQDASRKKLIISKVKSQTDQAKKEVVQLKSQFVKKQSQEEEYLLSQIPNPCSQMLSSHDRRIQQAKKQISEYLQIRQKPNPNFHKSKPLKSAPQQPDQPLLISTHQQQPPSQPKNPQSQPTAYSFSTNIPFPSSCTPDNQNFQPKTRKQMKQICQEQMEKEHQEMLACIQYTQSEVDLVEDLGEMQAYKKNLEICQSIPQRTLKLDEQPRQQYTLQKYIPNHTLSQQQQKPDSQIKQKQEQPSQVYEQSQMIEKVPVQPSSSNQNSFRHQNSNEQENSEQNNVNISDHPTLEQKISNQSKEDASMELSDGYRCREVQVGEKKVPFHDVSSIDIHISDLDIDVGSQNNSQYNQSSQKANKQPQVIPILPPTLNTSDFQSIQNISIPSSKPSQPFSHNLEPTPSKTSNQSNLNIHLRELQIEKASSKPPVETSINSNQSLHKNVHTHGFIYKMRVHSRNNSFTSNYDSSVHGSEAANRRSFCGSSQASVYLQDGQSFQQHNMPNEVVQVRMDKFNKVGGHRVATQPEYVHNIQEQSSDSSCLEQLNPHQPLIQNIYQSTASIPTQSAVEPISTDPNIEIQLQSASNFENKQTDFDEGPQNKNEQICTKNVQTETQANMDQTKTQTQNQNQNQDKTPQSSQKTNQNQTQPQNQSLEPIHIPQTLQTLAQPESEPIPSIPWQQKQQNDQISQNMLENDNKQNGTQNVKIQRQVQMASKVEENVQSGNQENCIGGQSEIDRGKQLQCLSIVSQNLEKRNQNVQDKYIEGNSEGKFILGGEMRGEGNDGVQVCVQSVTSTQHIAQQHQQINIQNPIQTDPKKEIASRQKPQPQSQPRLDTKVITNQQPQISQICNTNKQLKQSIKTSKDDQPFQFDLDF